MALMLLRFPVNAQHHQTRIEITKDKNITRTSYVCRLTYSTFIQRRNKRSLLIVARTRFILCYKSDMIRTGVMGRKFYAPAQINFI